jgi:hypothetical protein
VKGTVFCIISSNHNKLNPITLEKKLNLYQTFHVLSKLHGASLGYFTSVFFTLFGLIWMMGVVGAIKLKAVVDSTDYINLCALAVAGGVLLIGTVHLAGNVPNECNNFVAKLQSAGDEFDMNLPVKSKQQQRKYLRKKIISIQVFGVKCHPIRVLQHNTIYHYFNGAVNCIVTFLVAYPHLGRTE